jgi:signal peptidase I
VADTSSDDSAPPQSAVLDEAPAEAPAADGAPAEPADEHAGGLAGEAVGPQENGTSHPVALSPWSHMSAAAKEFVVVVAMALGLSLIVKTWLMQAFYIPSGSMEDTLVLNDRVVVSKLTPGPFALHRGDIVVFADPGAWLGVHGATSRGPIVEAVSEALIFVGLLPDNSEDHLIKRVIGMPGDHVVCCDADKRITINGTAINENYLKPGNVPSATPFDITVPAGRVWVMGDHRSDSSDSRFHDPGGTGAQGSVPISLITGRAVALVWPLSHIKGLGTPDKVFAAIPPPRSAAASTATAGTQPVLAGGH